MSVSKFDLYTIYDEVVVGCTEANIDLSSIVLSKAHRDTALNTLEMSSIISKVVNDTLSGDSVIDKGDQLQILRMLNDSIRYNLDGKLRVVGLMLNEWLPKRLDYRNRPRPSMNPVNYGCVLGNRSVLGCLSKESTDYISYLVRMSTNSDDYSAKLPINDYKVVFNTLESLSTLWQLDPIENKTEMLYCRLLAEVNEQGVPIQMANASDDKTMVLREVIPVVHAIARYRRASQSPFYKFVNMMPSVLVECINVYSSEMSVRSIDLIADLLNDMIAFNVALKNNSDAASQFLSRFHHGHPLYTDMIQVLKEQHTLMMTTGSDLMFRFGVFIKILGPQYMSDIITPIDNFLKETRLDQVYRTQQAIQS